jgi:catechol 2,3-dioxygenase-like lactoylglutathione lyase family enzyme
MPARRPRKQSPNAPSPHRNRAIADIEASPDDTPVNRFPIPARAVTLGLAKNRAKCRRSLGATLGEDKMFSHVMIGTNDLEKAKLFYDALLGTLDIPPGRVDRHRIFYRSKTGTFSVSKPIDGKEACHANGGTIGFTANSPEQADAFHAAGLAHGGKTCEDPPGIREGTGMKLYIAYLRDPDGNKLCALHRVAT